MIDRKRILGDIFNFQNILKQLEFKNDENAYAIVDTEIRKEDRTVIKLLKK